MLKLIYQGSAVRRVAATNMNDQSSRSHSVFTIRIEQKTTTDISGGLVKEQTVKAKVNLVDLAGSERADKTGASGSTLKEGANINKSLMTLGNVINKLSEGIKKGGKVVIPYRESKLTRLLQESLGGNSATVMIASISPADYNYLETISTLKYANRAKSIANAVTRNEDSNERMIRDLQAQIEALKQKLLEDAAKNQNGEATTVVMESPELIAKLKEMEASKINAWEEKEKLSRALEAERQANMNVAISGMMQSVKEEKVQHMKNIKRLTNEKALVKKNFEETKDSNVSIKVALDKNIKLYQQYQATYDEKMSNGDDASDLDDAKVNYNSLFLIMYCVFM
jgi:kinesin family protein 1/kinesin family protein 3/17